MKTKLSPSQVLEILRQRTRRDPLTGRRRSLASIGEEFGVSKESVRLIEQRRVWKKLLSQDGLPHA